MDPGGFYKIIEAHKTLGLLNITPKQMDEMINTMTGHVTLAGVSNHRFQAWKSLYPEVADTHRYRFEYDSRACQVVLKCIPEPIYTALGSFFTTKVEDALRSCLGNNTFNHYIELVARKITFTGFSGVYNSLTQKVPDAFYRFNGDVMPTVVCCTGWANDMVDLCNDTKTWLLGTRSQTKVVIVLVFHETMINGPASFDTVAKEFPEEHKLLLSINQDTQYHNLAAEILQLHRQGRLFEPLIGTFRASVHLFRRNAAGNDIDEVYGATVYPVQHTFRPQSFSLTFEDFLGSKCFQLHNYNPRDKIQFPLASLRGLIMHRLQQQAKLRSYSRAISLMKSHGLWKDKQTALPKGIKRKWRYT